MLVSLGGLLFCVSLSILSKFNYPGWNVSFFFFLSRLGLLTFTMESMGEVDLRSFIFLTVDCGDESTLPSLSFDFDKTLLIVLLSNAWDLFVIALDTIFSF